MVYYQHADGRVCIVFRFRDKVIMGSTDIPVDDPDKANFDDREIEYMLATLRSVFPDIKVTREQIVFAFCGVRPLPSAKSAVTANISRGHTIHCLEPDGVRKLPIICLIGGKWTTFRALAEQTADKILPRIGATRRCSTANVPIGQKDPPVTDNTPLASLPSYTVGQIEQIAGNDYVVHLADIIYRRTTIGLLGNATPDTLLELAGIVGRVLGWDAERQTAEVTRALPPPVNGAPRTGAQKAGPGDWTRIMHVMRSSNQ
jgi:glycerol-3-phosphate dehydrogenase